MNARCLAGQEGFFLRVAKLRRWAALNLAVLAARTLLTSSWFRGRHLEDRVAAQPAFNEDQADDAIVSIHFSLTLAKADFTIKK
jgi:hypothetical protein